MQLQLVESVRGPESRWEHDIYCDKSLRLENHFDDLFFAFTDVEEVMFVSSISRYPSAAQQQADASTDGSARVVIIFPVQPNL